MSADLEAFFEHHHVPTAGREFVRKALTGPPVRRVRSSGGNVVARFASHKMGRVIQAESRTLELAFVEYCEYTSEVVLYLCQPGELYVRITDSRGRERRVRHVPDYLVLDDNGFSLVECKPVDKLQRDAASANPKFTRDDSGWRWPAAEDAAAELGLAYRVFSSENVNPIWIRNVRFFSDYIEVDCPDSELAQTVMNRISRAGAMRVCDAMALVDGKSEIVWWLLANGEILADLQCERVFETDTSWVYSSMSRMLAARCQRRSAVDPALFPGICSVRVEPGCVLRWDGEPWVVLYRGNEDVVLRRDAIDGDAPFRSGILRRFFVQGRYVGRRLRPPNSWLSGVRRTSVVPVTRTWKML